FLGIKDFVEATSERHPLALEDALHQIVLDALKTNDCVILDDFHVATAAMNECHFYPRSGYLESPLTVLATYAVEAGKKLIIGTNSRLPAPLRERSFGFSIRSFTPDDYRHLCQGFLSDESLPLDFAKVHRFAPKLNGHQLKLASVWCQQQKSLNTNDFIEYLRSQQLTSNVALGEVAEVDLKELQGVDDVLKSLEANIVVPLENDELANELNLKPKRGVLLVGPPGTGKTTVGRALAHRLRGKFFLVDGTFISGTREFYNMVHQVFQAAKDNAPSVIFIDDSDVIFESGQEHGLYRYLLTMLDGLESESAGRVCVMMTAMDVGNLPPALVRSGRIELWLEMRLPDESARSAILQQHIETAPAPLNGAEISQIVQATDGFTGADLKRTLEDGKALYAFDRVAGVEIKPATEYYVAAAETVGANKDKYMEAEARANASRPTRPVWFNPYSHYDFGDAEE
ncbi:MAG: ATP-binding protein, partial [Planctomycetaceae bacterium]|nr:ATP-binding protein [Planctomycetaceae bacterium]